MCGEGCLNSNRDFQLRISSQSKVTTQGGAAISTLFHHLLSFWWYSTLSKLYWRPESKEAHWSGPYRLSSQETEQNVVCIMLTIWNLLRLFLKLILYFCESASCLKKNLFSICYKSMYLVQFTYMYLLGLFNYVIQVCCIFAWHFSL